MVMPISGKKDFVNYYALHPMDAPTTAKKIKYSIGSLALLVATGAIFHIVQATREWQQNRKFTDESSGHEKTSTLFREIKGQNHLDEYEDVGPEVSTLFSSKGQDLREPVLADLFKELDVFRSDIKEEHERLNDKSVSIPPDERQRMQNRIEFYEGEAKKVEEKIRKFK